MSFWGLRQPLLRIFWFFLILLALNGCSGSISPTQTAAIDLPSSTPAAELQMATSTTVLATTHTPELCNRQTGQIIDASVPSKLLFAPIALKIYLPPCYSKNSTLRYPVLYMLHGQTYTNDQWVRIGITASADKLIGDKRIDPMIIVMPNEDSSMTDPSTSKFGDAVVSEVIPWVDANLNTCAVRDCRAIGGLSRGGNWAVRIGLSNWQLFAAIGAHSTPLFFGDLSRIGNWVREAPAGEDVPVLYVDYGKSDENRKEIAQFNEELDRLGVVHDFSQFIGFHEEKYWSAHVEDYLRWYSVHLSTGTQ